jgi:hypothetical protein
MEPSGQSKQYLEKAFGTLAIRSASDVNTAIVADFPIKNVPLWRHLDLLSRI